MYLELPQTMGWNTERLVHQEFYPLRYAYNDTSLVTLLLPQSQGSLRRFINSISSHSIRFSYACRCVSVRGQNTTLSVFVGN